MASTGAEGYHFYLVSAKVDTSQDIQDWTVDSRLSSIQQQLQQFQLTFPRSHTFKVVGEPLIIAVFEVAVDHIAIFDLTMQSLFKNTGVTYDCEVLTSYEKFAKETLGVSETLTKRESDDYLANGSTLLWCQNTLDFKGKTRAVINDIWRIGATIFLEKRKNLGVKSEIYKVVGQPKIHAFVSMSLHQLDKDAFQQPVNLECAGAVARVVKVVTVVH